MNWQTEFSGGIDYEAMYLIQTTQDGYFAGHFKNKVEGLVFIAPLGGGTFHPENIVRFAVIEQ